MNNDETSGAKRKLRRRIAERKKEMAFEERSSGSDRILEQLEQHPLFLGARTVLLYHALPDEVQTERLLQRWHAEKRLLLPVVRGDELELRLYAPNRMQPGAFGIPEPVGAPFTAFDEIDLCIVPGVAFDRTCNRMGRGKGYYDRLLPRIAAPCIGICFDCQLVKAVPADPHDQPVQAVVTEHEWIER